MIEWKNILWYENYYQISNKGEVKSLNRKIVYKDWITRLHKWKPLKLAIDRFWYLHISLSKYWNKKYFRINRLVWQVFLWLDISNSKVFVCHKDDNPLNNCVDNLFLGTHTDNMQDMIKKWRWVDNKWEKHWKSKLTHNNILEIKILLKQWIIQSEIAKIFNISRSVITNINIWKAWKHIL